MEAVSLGSMQILGGSGNIFIGWGHSAAFTEFSPNGRVLCNIHYGPSAWNTFGRLKSYRVFRGTWIGNRTEPISAAFEGKVMYVSWSGATQVSRWQLQVQRDDNGEFEIVSQVFKDGFETEIVVPLTLKLGSLVRIQGLNSKGNVLGPSDIVEITAQKETPFFTVGILLILSGIAILVSVIFVVKRRQNGSSQNNGQYQLLPVAK
jgi:hypothetical protein